MKRWSQHTCETGWSSFTSAASKSLEWWQLTCSLRFRLCSSSHHLKALRTLAHPCSRFWIVLVASVNTTYILLFDDHVRNTCRPCSKTVTGKKTCVGAPCGSTHDCSRKQLSKDSTAQVEARIISSLETLRFGGELPGPFGGSLSLPSPLRA